MFFKKSEIAGQTVWVTNDDVYDELIETIMPNYRFCLTCLNEIGIENVILPFTKEAYVKKSTVLSEDENVLGK